MKGIVEKNQVGLERADEMEKEKKKRRRQNRRSKQNPSPLLGTGCSSADRICGQASEGFGNNVCSNYVGNNGNSNYVGNNGSSNYVGNNGNSNYVSLPVELSPSNKREVDIHASEDQGGLVRASNVTFGSLPTMHINSQAKSTELGSMQDQNHFPSDLDGIVLAVSSSSCPDPISYEKTKLPSPNKEFLPCHENEGHPDMTQRKYFATHLSLEAVNEAIEKGGAFRASFRVNAHNRLEAYCTLDGVPIDVLINGIAAQNRAIEGDIVAVRLDPVASWTKLKGSASRLCNCIPSDDSDVLPGVTEVVGDNYKGKAKVDVDSEYPVSRNVLLPSNGRYHYQEHLFTGEPVDSDLVFGPSSSNNGANGHHLALYPSNRGCVSEQGEAASALGKVCAMISSFPSKRPTGRVLGIIEKSPRRDAIVGFLGVKHLLSYKEGCKKEIGGQLLEKIKNTTLFPSREYIHMTPSDPKFPKMMVSVRSLPECIKDRLKNGDVTVEMELIAARIDAWKEESFLPEAHVMHVFGRGGEIEPQIAAILFENAVHVSRFSSESLACLPNVPWKLPEEELKRRRDLRNLCTFTIDPSTATELDDALSVERVSDDIFRVGVHIADVSYFVLPDTALDIEAQARSTSVYLLKHKVPMLPSLLSEELGSLIPGVDRLALSITWDINLAGSIIDHWIGRTVIRSCCKLSYQNAQDIIDGSLNGNSHNISENGCPELYGHFEWYDVIKSVRSLLEISKRLKENRFKDGALCLENPKLVLLFDDCGMPYDSKLCERTDSNFLVEEFMLLANKMVAEIVSRVFPDSALLRRHPEPNLRKLKEFEAFCGKHGFELDISSSSQLHLSLQKIQEELKNDPVLSQILISYAVRPMQLALYFCTGDLHDRENDWAHYALAAPFYTHFTSPLRRYPDIIVHRTLNASLDAEEMYLQQWREIKGDAVISSDSEFARKCFTGFYFDKHAVESIKGREAICAAALKHRILGSAGLAEVAAYCNERKLASRLAVDAGDKVYLWALLKKKESMISDARILGLGPKFMSIYIHKLAMERRIYYDDVDGLIVEWLETTSTLVLGLCTNKRFQKRGGPGKYRRLEDVALVVNPCDLNSDQVVVEESNHKVETTQVGPTRVAPKGTLGVSEKNGTDPAVFPLTLRLLSYVPIVLHAVGGDCGPLDIGARLYLSSYFR
ncbi:ribonuclease II/R family protein [Tasmannia lanceolata]|uniref:ribonuclease II/R family protein n=1 Tax=Tasmannia lanceolata TaxID=3420 RepID=UPI004062810E